MARRAKPVKDLVHVPGRMSKSMIPVVNKRREREGHSWSFVIDRLLKLYVRHGDSLFQVK